MTLTQVEVALQNWLEEASGLDDAHVIFADQDGPRPSRPFITIRAGKSMPMGACDTVTEATDLSAPAGEEISQTVLGYRRLPVSVQAYSDATHGVASATAILEQVSLALAFESDALPQGMSIPVSEGVGNLAALDDNQFRGRAVLELVVHYVSSLTRKVGYIASVELHNLETDTTTVVS